MNKKAILARAPSGWAEPVKLTNEQRNTIRRELSERRLVAFRDRGRQDAFLARVEGSLTYLSTREGAQPDPHRSQDRIAALHKALMEAERALSIMEQPERAAIEHGQAGQIATFAQDVATVREKAKRAVDALTMPRGGQDRERASARLLVQQMAEGWFFVFERKPSAKEDGAFFAVANTVLRQIGRPGIGKDALRTILKGAVFKG